MESRKRYGLILLSTLALAAAACKDSTTTTATVNAVLVSPSTPSLVIGDSVQLSATPVDFTGSPMMNATVTWSSSDATVATVTSTGKVVSRKVGAALITAMAGGVQGHATLNVTAAASGSPVFGHVFIVGLLETDYASVFPATGSSPMPFLDSLSRVGGRALQYYGNVQPSIGNFYMLATGDTVTHDDADTTVFTGENIVRQLVAAGKTWKSYAESIPSVGYLGSDLGLYSRHHNVFVFLSDVRNDPAQRQNIVPLTQLSADITANALPNFGMIVPNECHNSHSGCTLDTVDAFLRTTLTPLLTSAQFKQDGMLIVLFDRANTSALNGGGRTAWVVVSSRAKPGYTSTTIFQHQSTLRLALNAFGIGVPGSSAGSLSVPGVAATAPSMMEFFQP